MAKPSEIRGGDSGDSLETIRKLKLQVQHRDNEIGILVSMLKKLHSNVGPKGGGDAPLPLIGGDAPAIMAAARERAPQVERSGTDPSGAVASAAPSKAGGPPIEAWGDKQEGAGQGQEHSRGRDLQP